VTGTAFSEGHVEVAGGRVPCLRAGQGPPLLHLQAGDAPAASPAHALLTQRFRVLVVAGPAASRPATLTGVVGALGLETFNLMATGATTATALGLALAMPTRVQALVLAPPAALDAGLERRLPEIDTPTLALVGTRDGVAPAVARTCRARVPDSHLVLVYDAGPALDADRPVAFAEVVADFLERRDAFVISAGRTVINP
jgi:pimeloyl-ACP methyl ester carboxylesterase